MTPTERAHIRYRYLTDPKFNVEHHQMADLVAGDEHWHIALELSLYGRAFVWVSPLGKCLLLNEDELIFKHPKAPMGPTKVYMKMSGGEEKEIPDCDRNLVELVMVGDTDYRKASNGFVELRKLKEIQMGRRGF